MPGLRLTVTQEKTPVEQALDLFLYAPVGLAVIARDELPKLVDRGRRQLTDQVTVARTVGQIAVGQGQRQMEKVVRQAGRRLSELGLVPDPWPQEAEARARPPAPASPEPGSGPSRAADAATGASSEQLAIPGYDALSAPQVVQRLAGLSPDELEAVRAYEAATRGRRTILNRIAQLQSPPS